MAHNEQLTQRVREALKNIPNVAEKKMFRGTSFIVDGKMCITTGNDELMCRIDPQSAEATTMQDGVRTMEMRGRPYAGYLYIKEAIIKEQAAFDRWIGLALDYNKCVKPSKKKAK